ncbi:MAG: PQQ-binding-like beta-propeller repeat protein [Planctomycetaceae bacterium]
MKFTGCLAFGLFVCLFAAGVSAEDWPQFRGPTGQGISAEKNLPAEFGPAKNVAWRVTIPGAGWSSPIVHKGRVYLTSAVTPPGGEGTDRSLRAICLDAKTGQAAWDVEVFQQKDEDVERIHGKNSHASPTPVTDGRRLFVHFGPQGTACLTLDGKVVWRRKVRYSPRHGSGCSPILVGDLVVFSCDGQRAPFLIALDKATGRIRWKKPRPPVEDPKTFSFATPLAIRIGGTTQIVSPATGQVVSYEAGTGREIWKVRYDGFSVIPRPVYAHGLVFLSTSYMRPQVLAIQPTGKGDVTGSHLKWSIARGAPNTPSALAVGDELYFISDRGIASCVNAKTGKVHWQKRLGGKYSSSPVFADGKIYFQSEQGDATVISAGTTFRRLAKNAMKERTLASYAVADGALFIRTATKLYRIQKRNK